VVVAPDAPTVRPAPLRPTTTFRILFSGRYRRRAILAGMIGCLQSIEYYAIVFYLPVIAQLILGESLLNALLGGIVFSTIGVIGSTTQAWVCDRTGLRPLTIAGAITAGAAMLGIALGHAASLVAIEAFMVGAFMIGHTIGPGPQGMAYGTLSFPTLIRGTAVGWTQGILRIGSIIGFLVFPIMMDNLGFTATFALLSIVPFAILLGTMVIRWEPIGVDVEAEWAELRASGAPEAAPLADQRPARVPTPTPARPVPERLSP
jgi:MFS family permease